MALVHKDTCTITKDRITRSTNTSRRNKGIVTKTTNKSLTDHAQAVTALSLHLEEKKGDPRKVSYFQNKNQTNTKTSKKTQTNTQKKTQGSSKEASKGTLSRLLFLD